MLFFLSFTSVTGCRNALVNMEARPISSPMLTRRCILTRLSDLTADRYRDIIEQSAGALLVLLPQNLSSLAQEVIQVLLMITVILNSTKDLEVQSRL